TQKSGLKPKLCDNRIRREFYERLETLEINATPEHRESLDFQHEQGKVMLELQQRKKEVVQAWLAEQKLP
ncbi:MAG: hypothetical protein WCG42_09935, partial [Parachlamydiaceae bacterium]